MKCGALILAAGASRRLGIPKQIVLLQGETLLDRSIRVATEAGCDPIVIVLGAHQETIQGQCQLRGVHLVFNPQWDDGIGTSLAKGAAAFDDVDGIVVMTCDMPFVLAPHILALAASGMLTASSYAGQRGIPAYFPRHLLEELRRMSGQSGAKELLRLAQTVELVGGDMDIDTPDDLTRLRGEHELSGFTTLG